LKATAPKPPAVDVEPDVDHLDDIDSFPRKNIKPKSDLKKKKTDRLEATMKKDKAAPQKSSKRYADDGLEEERKRQSQPRDIYLPEGISVVNLGSLLGVSYGMFIQFRTCIKHCVTHTESR
jgi:hypothetical protein